VGSGLPLAQAKKEERSMSEDIKAIARKYLVDLHGKDFAPLVDEIIDPNYMPHSTSWPPGAPLNREGLRQLMERYQTALPDRKVTIDKMVAEGDTVAALWTFSGTHLEELEGLPPTGKHVSWSGISMFRIAGGKIVESWGYWDVSGKYQQLGADASPIEASVAQ